MGGLLIIFAAIIAIGVFDILATALGVDSRPEFEDQHAPARGLGY